MTPDDKHRKVVSLRVQIETLQKELAQMEAAPTRTPCIDCLQCSDKETFYCQQWDEVVPAEHREQEDCPHFEDDIPF